MDSLFEVCHRSARPGPPSNPGRLNLRNPKQSAIATPKVKNWAFFSQAQLAQFALQDASFGVAVLQAAETCRDATSLHRKQSKSRTSAIKSLTQALLPSLSGSASLELPNALHGALEAFVFATILCKRNPEGVHGRRSQR